MTFDPSLPMVSLNLSRIQGSDQLVAMVMACASAWMEASLSDRDAGQRWVIYDEAWRMIRQPALLARMQSQWKLSRGLGIANLMVIHRLSDLDAVGGADSEARALAQGLLADCSTKIVYQQETSRAHTADVPRPVRRGTGPAARFAGRRRAVAGRTTRLRRPAPRNRRGAFITRLPAGLDPADWIRARGATGLAAFDREGRSPGPGPIAPALPGRELARIALAAGGDHIRRPIKTLLRLAAAIPPEQAAGLLSQAEREITRQGWNPNGVFTAQLRRCAMEAGVPWRPASQPGRLASGGSAARAGPSAVPLLS